MDEGVAGYLSYVAILETGYRDNVEAWHELQFEIARKALAEGRWIPISAISLEKDWNAAEIASPGLAFAEAYVLVNYLVTNYGLDRCISIYQLVSHNGYVAESALDSQIGLVFRELETVLQEWLEGTAP
jgi:hypothetical protein